MADYFEPPYIGTPNPDEMFGTSDGEVFKGFEGADNIFGEGGDKIYGGDDGDWIEGGDGNDTMLGGRSMDTMDGGAGHDAMSGGAKGDVMSGGFGNDCMKGDGGFDIMFGGFGKDTMLGGDGIDVMSGDFDDDMMDGGSGIDLMLGGEGNDLMTGGKGNDILTGGTGSDTFAFRQDEVQGNADFDTITDWDSSDKILLCGQIDPFFTVEKVEIGIFDNFANLDRDVRIGLSNGQFIVLLDAGDSGDWVADDTDQAEARNADNFLRAASCEIDCIVERDGGDGGRVDRHDEAGAEITLVSTDTSLIDASFLELV